MIEKLTYEEILNISNELRVNAEIIERLLQNKNVSELQDFISTVEGYSKYLETVVGLHKDADKALLELKEQKNRTF